MNLTNLIHFSLAKIVIRFNVFLIFFIPGAWLLPHADRGAGAACPGGLPHPAEDAGRTESAYISAQDA